jgi:putative flippase GtrA
MPLRFNIRSIPEIWRYYQAGILNSLFGFLLYAALVRFGFNIFVAQIIAHFCGVVFNYVTYSKHVFRNSSPAKLKFFLSYVGNYLMSVVTLMLIAQVIDSPYLAGLVTLIIVSLLNYFILKNLVFVSRMKS